jgi:hypothetical protein
MTINKELAKKMSVCFNKAQKSSSNHQKQVEELQKLCKKENKEFFKIFFQMIKPILTEFKKEPNVERLIGFIVKFGTLVNDEDENFELDLEITISSKLLK